MQAFDKSKRMILKLEIEDYYKYVQNYNDDEFKLLFNHPILDKELLIISYKNPQNQVKRIRVFPTV